MHVICEQPVNSPTTPSIVTNCHDSDFQTGLESKEKLPLTSRWLRWAHLETSSRTPTSLTWVQPLISTCLSSGHLRLSVCNPRSVKRPQPFNKTRSTAGQNGGDARPSTRVMLCTIRIFKMKLNAICAP